MQTSKPKVQEALSANSDVGETIDGVERVQAAEDAPRSPVPTSPARDYPELIEVARDHYVIGDEIAKGGMGRVFEARDLRLGRAVAIKELLPRNREFARRFEREARITAKLQHPAIINIHEAGVWAGGEPFYAMTKVAGRSLDVVVGELSTLAERIGLLPNVIAVADALAYAHSQHVIHRDLKPSNVLVGEFGETVVIDWGLAKDLAGPLDPAMSLQLKQCAEETLSGSVVGTPAYMPPEQARAETVDQRADVYALGALLYHVLVGSAPYLGTSSKDVLAQVLAGPPVPVEKREPGAPADLVTIVAKAMDRDPERRYPTASELAADLKRFQTGQLVAAHHYTRAQLVWRWLRRNRLVVGIATAATIAVAVVGTLSIRSVIDERNRAEREQRLLLEERGLVELWAGRAGIALVNFAGAVGRGTPHGALAFLIAEAMRPFEAELATLPVGTGDVLVAYRPDGKAIATATSHGDLAVWEGASTRTLLVRSHLAPIHALAWSPDGADLASGGDDGVVRIWRGPNETRTFSAPGAVTDVEFSPDGTHLLAASADGIARVWTLATADPPQTFDPSMNPAETLFERPFALTSARFDPDGVRVVTAAVDGSVNVWGPKATEGVTPLRQHTGAVHVVRWSPAGDLVLTAGADGTARIWSPLLGKVVVAWIFHDRNASIETAAWSHDGRRVITAGSDRVARVWELPARTTDTAVVPSARLVAELRHTDTVVACQFSADDRWIATADRVARVWDADGQRVAEFEQADAVRSIAFSADGNTLVAGTHGGTARVWDVVRARAREPVNLENPVHAIAVARDGTVAAGTDDSRIVIWNGPMAGSRPLRKHLGSVLALAFSPDGSQLISAGDDEAAYLWTVRKPGEPRALPILYPPVHAVAFSPDGNTIAFGDDSGVLWLARARAAGPPRPLLGLPGAIAAISFSPRGDRIAGVTPDGSVVVWGASLAIIARTTLTIPRLAAVAFDPTGTRLVVAGAGEAQLLELAGANIVPTLTIEGPTGEVRSIAFSHDGTRVFTAGGDGVARIWDAARGKLLATRDPHGGAIEAIALSSDDAQLWTASSDGTAREWDVHSVDNRVDVPAFIAAHVPWRLGDDDVVLRVTDTHGGSDDQR